MESSSDGDQNRPGIVTGNDVATRRKPYRKPVLVTYGPVHALTQSTFNGPGMLDGAGGAFGSFFKT